METRPYRMVKRAERTDETRNRIVDAAVRLHTTIGPAHTTIAAVAEEAGVTRLTVYRHFPDAEQLFTACSGKWIVQHPPPDPGQWRSIPGLRERARAGLTDLYAWYRANADDLLPLQRDIDAMPAMVRTATESLLDAAADALVDHPRLRGRTRRVARAVTGHAVSYWTWRSLVQEQGLRNTEAVDVAVRCLVAAAR